MSQNNIKDKKIKQKTKAEKKAEEIRDFRQREGFLPYYSDTLFESIVSYRRTILGVGAYVCLYVGILFMAFEKKNLFIGLCIFVVLVLLGNAFWGDFENLIKKYGYQILPDKLLLRKWGIEKEISYQEIIDAASLKKVKITSKTLNVPVGKNKIKFHYEVGDAKQQACVMACYEKLREKTSDSLPAFQIKNIAAFDKTYFYNRSFRKCVIALIFAQFGVFFWSFGDNSNMFYFIFNGITAFIQYFSFFRLFKSIKCSQKNMESMKESIEENLGFDIAIKVHTYREYITIVVAVLLLNFLTIRRILPS